MSVSCRNQSINLHCKEPVRLSEKLWEFCKDLWLDISRFLDVINKLPSTTSSITKLTELQPQRSSVIVNQETFNPLMHMPQNKSWKICCNVFKVCLTIDRHASKDEYHIIWNEKNSKDALLQFLGK